MTTLLTTRARSLSARARLPATRGQQRSVRRGSKEAGEQFLHWMHALVCSIGVAEWWTGYVLRALGAATIVYPSREGRVASVSHSQERQTWPCVSIQLTLSQTWPVRYWSRGGGVGGSDGGHANGGSAASLVGRTSVARAKIGSHVCVLQIGDRSTHGDPPHFTLSFTKVDHSVFQRKGPLLSGGQPLLVGTYPECRPMLPEADYSTWRSKTAPSAHRSRASFRPIFHCRLSRML